MTVLAKRVFFFHSYSVQYVTAKDTSQLKMLYQYGYPEGEYCQYSSLRSLCYEAKKTKNKNKKTEIS